MAIQPSEGEEACSSLQHLNLHTRVKLPPGEILQIAYLHWSNDMRPLVDPLNTKQAMSFTARRRFSSPWQEMSSRFTFEMSSPFQDLILTFFNERHVGGVWPDQATSHWSRSRQTPLAVRRMFKANM